MIQTDIFKLTCYNCGKIIGIIKINEPISTDNNKQEINQIIREASCFESKLYCLDCLNKIFKDK